MKIPISWVASGLVIALIIGFGVAQCRDREQVVQSTQQADVAHTQAEVHSVAADTQDQAALVLATEISALKAEVERLRKVSAPHVTPDNPLVPVVKAQDRVIEAQGQEIKTVSSARDERKAEATAYKSEAQNLRVALGHTPKFYPWAAGLVYGSDGSKGITAEYDIKRLRLGADMVVRTRANRQEYAVNARILWRFGK